MLGQGKPCSVELHNIDRALAYIEPTESPMALSIQFVAEVIRLEEERTSTKAKPKYKYPPPTEREIKRVIEWPRTPVYNTPLTLGE